MLNRAEELVRIGSWELLHDTGELVWSDQTYRIFGLVPQQRRPSHQLLMSFVHPDDRERVTRMVQGSLLSPGSYELMYRLRLADGTIRVVLETGQCNGNATNGTQISIGTIQDITEYQDLQERLEQANFVDSVTQLANKVASPRYLHALSQPSAGINGFGLIDPDLDLFQSINDTYGICIGNQLLFDLGQRQHQALQPSDWVAWIGSDEFLVVRPQPDSLASLVQLAEELQDALGRTWSAGDQLRLRPSFSVGVALCPLGAASEQEALQWANTALMEAKRRGRRQLELYSSSLSQRVSERLRLEHGLARAIEVAPAVFIPLAEQTGQIHAIGAWVIQAAFATLAQW